MDQESKGGGGDSYCNEGEADRAVAVTAWQMLHGTHASRIAIITPYAGQVTLIRRKLQKLPALVLAAASAGVPEGSAAAAKAASGSVLKAPHQSRSRVGADRGELVVPSKAEATLPRVCTVDEFQGDEADFVVLSLVRCNAEGKLGFVEKVNRVTVALSRARRALVIVASARHLRRSKPCARVLKTP